MGSPPPVELGLKPQRLLVPSPALDSQGPVMVSCAPKGSQALQQVWGKTGALV